MGLADTGMLHDAVRCSSSTSSLTCGADKLWKAGAAPASSRSLPWVRDLWIQWKESVLDWPLISWCRNDGCLYIYRVATVILYRVATENRTQCGLLYIFQTLPVQQSSSSVLETVHLIYKWINAVRRTSPGVWITSLPQAHLIRICHWQGQRQCSSSLQICCAWLMLVWWLFSLRPKCCVL